jgi:hypothetical protein
MAASLHDPLIPVDGIEVWSQSFNDMAERSHTSIVKSAPDLAAMKVQSTRSDLEAGESL